ncbi:hypothetical protein [Pararhizobium haloflavum]|uniref:hypothetical protein n=1 Tax=Pararhizobium haloflavum TaxID=2037914 RepID=UPI000C18BE03|nr:hypothetical protein [Pararhizobium haloflavum]
MDGLETAIRNALARAGNPDATARARIYESARAALEKSLQKQSADAQTLAAQRQRVEGVITAIESSYADKPAPAQVGPDTTISTDEPALTEVRAERSDAPGAADPVFSEDVAPEREAPPVALDPVSRQSPATAEALAVDAVSRAGGEVAHGGVDDRLGPEVVGRARSTGPSHGEPRPRRRFFSRSGRAKPVKEPATAKTRKRRRGSSVLSLIAQLAFLFVFIALGLWWISANGGVEQVGRRLADSGVGMLSEDGGDAAVDAPAQRVGAGQFSGTWQTVFDADAFESAVAGGAATVETVEEGEAPALRIASIDAGAPGEVRIPLDPEVLGQLAGGAALVALTVRAAGDEATQIYVRCSLGTGEDCGRRRFDVNQTPSDLVIDVDLAAGVSPEPALIVNSDVAGEGKRIDLFSVRAQPAS